MKNLIDNLKKTINKNSIIPVENDKLRFTEPKVECHQVILKSKIKDIFSFSLDKHIKNKCDMFPFFDKSTPHITKVNDGIVFCLKNQQIFILLIELKSKNVGLYKKQLQAGKNFVSYLLEVLNSSFKETYEIKNENIRCLVFTSRKTEKKQGTTRTPIKYETINGLNIARLECNTSHFIEKFI